MDETNIINKLLAIFFSVSIFGYALILKHKAQSWVTPGVIFAIFWFLFTFFPLTVMFNIPTNPWATLFIASCVFMFGLPGLVSGLKTPLALNIQTKHDSLDHYSGAFLTLTFISLQCITVLFILINLSIQGFSPADFVTDLFGTANQYLALRYSGKIESNIFAQLGVLLNYTGVCIGGLILGSKIRKIEKFIILVLSFVPAALHMIVYADKGTLFLCASLFYGGVIISRLRKGDTALTNKATNKILFFSLLILIPVLISSFLARGIDSSNAKEVQDKLVYYLSSYAFGHLYAFSDWFANYNFDNSWQNYYHDVNPTLGFSTFMAIFRALGDLTPVPDGYYDEYFQYKEILQTNIYTIYRGLIQDFGIVGTLFYMVITGTLFNLAYIKILSDKNPVISVAVYICMAGYIYTSFIISIMVWNSIFALFITLSTVLLANKKYQKKRAKIANQETQTTE